MRNLFANFLVFIVLIAITIYYSVHPQVAPLKADLTFQTVLGALGAIFIIVLLVERFTEIAVTIWYQPTTDQLKEEIDALSKDPAKIDEMQKKSRELAAYKVKTKSFALLFGFSASVIVCSAGIGLLSILVEPGQANGHLIRGVDILLTSGLIAGGSDAFHQFVSALETFFVESKKKMENRP